MRRREPGEGENLSGPEYKKSEYEPREGTGGNFVDKVGNIRLDKYNMPDDVKSIIKEIMNGFVDSFDPRWTEAGFAQEQATRAARYLLSATKDAMLDAIKSKDSLAYLRASQQLEIAQNELRVLTFSAGRTLRVFKEIVPSKYSGDLDAIIKNRTGKTLEQLNQEMELVKEIDNPQGVADFIEQNRKGAWRKGEDYILALFRNSILSGIITHGAYLAGNTLGTVYEATALNASRKVIFGKDATEMAKLTEIQLHGMYRGLLNSMPVAYGALKSGVPFMKGSIEHLAGEALDNIVSGKVGKDATLEAAIKEFKANNLKREDINSSLVLKSSDKAERVAQYDKYPAISKYLEKSVSEGSKRYEQSLPGKIGYALTIPERAIQAVHTVSYAANYEVYIAWKAHQAGVDAGFRGDELSTYIEGYVKRPPAKAALEAHQASLDAIFMGAGKQHVSKIELAGKALTHISEGKAGEDPYLANAISEMNAKGLTNETIGKEIKAKLLLDQSKEKDVIEARNQIMQKYPDITKYMSKYIEKEYKQPKKSIEDLASNFINNDIPGIRVVTQLAVPFVKISLRIAEAGLINNTPLGFLKESIRADIRGDNGIAARQNAIARMTAGSFVGMTFVGLAANGNLTGSMPTDPKEREKLPPGWKPNAFHIGELYIPVPKWAGRFSDLIVASSALGNAGRSLAHDDYHHAAVALSAGFGGLMDENFIGSLSKLHEAMTSEHGVITFVNNIIPSFVPYSAFQSQIEHSVDPYARQVTNQGPANLWGLLPRMANKTFLAGELLLPKYDVYGDPVPGATQVSIGHGGTNPIEQKLSELDIGIAPCKYVMGGVRLTDQEYNEYTRSAGVFVKKFVGDMISVPSFSTFSHSEQVIKVDSMVRISRDIAFAALQTTHPHLTDRIYKAKLIKVNK